MFATKPQLAGDLLDHAHALGIRAAFVAGDEVYGGRELRREHPPARDGLCAGGPRQPHRDRRLGPHRDRRRELPA